MSFFVSFSLAACACVLDGGAYAHYVIGIHMSNGSQFSLPPSSIHRQTGRGWQFRVNHDVLTGPILWRTPFSTFPPDFFCVFFLAKMTFLTPMREFTVCGSQYVMFVASFGRCLLTLCCAVKFIESERVLNFLSMTHQYNHDLCVSYLMMHNGCHLFVRSSHTSCLSQICRDILSPL